VHLPQDIIALSSLRCCHAWRSIGTHIWLEFGAPKIHMLRNGRRSIKGELTLHVSSYYWQFIAENQCVLSSDTVDDENFTFSGKQWLVGNAVEITRSASNSVKLTFTPNACLQVFRTHEEDPDPEIEIRTPNSQWWKFDFEHGWQLSTDS